MAQSTTALHALLLLSDSALPLGSFAFSSGLESFLAHRKTKSDANRTPGPSNGTVQDIEYFHAFLEQSLENLASTALPYVTTAARSGGDAEVKQALLDLDNDFDASTPCTVARRASISQGKALLAIWERALSSSTAPTDQARSLSAAVSDCALLVKSTKPGTASSSSYNGHLPPLFGAVAAAMGLPIEQTSYLFLLNHAKAILSAAVRASVLGPYQSQSVLASESLQVHIKFLNDRYGAVKAEDAAVSVPTMDVWMGRHELLYSRIFNS
nr:hypothetical protein B0A51_06357 [Rachicladosporium sp. CCFEE 5018]